MTIALPFSSCPVTTRRTCLTIDALRILHSTMAQRRLPNSHPYRGRVAVQRTPPGRRNARRRGAEPDDRHPARHVRKHDLGLALGRLGPERDEHRHALPIADVFVAE